MRLPIALLAVLAFAFQTSADWAQWRGPTRDGHVASGVAVPEQLPVELKAAWSIKINDGLASPVAAGGRVFYLDNQDGFESLHAVDAANGTELWRTNIDKVHKDSQSLPGPRCTPMVDGDRVYAQSCRGELRCLSVKDGGPLWHVNFVTDFEAIFIGERGNAQGATRHGYNGSPVVEGNMLIAQVGSTNGASVVAFDKTTGKALWKSQNDESSYAAPIVATVDGVRQVISFTAQGVIGLDVKDGTLLWRSPISTTFSRHATTPVVFGGMVSVSSHQAGLLGIKLTRAGDKWEAAQVWTNKDCAVNFASPVEVGGYLYCLGPTKNLFCVDLKTGKTEWSKTGYFNGDAGHSHVGMIVMKDKILALTDGGQLVLFKADPTECKEISVSQACGKTWCNPAYSDGKLYLRDGKELFCFKLLP